MLEIYVENIVEKGRNCSLGAISPFIHNILLPDVRYLCSNTDKIFSSRYAVIRGNRGRDNESRLYFNNSYWHETTIIFTI